MSAPQQIAELPIEALKPKPTKGKPFRIRHSDALVAAIELIKESKTLSAGMADTLIAIALHWNARDEIYPSQFTLAAKRGIDRRTIVTHVKKLRALGLITTFYKHLKGTDFPIIHYRFNAEAIGALFAKAKAALKAKAKKALSPRSLRAKAAWERKRKLAAGEPVELSTASKNDHFRALEKDLTNNQLNKFNCKEDLQNTERSQPKKTADLAHEFLAQRAKALIGELNHITKQKMLRAYNAATNRNKIQRGELFTPEKQAKVDAQRKAGRLAAEQREERQAPARAASEAASTRLLVQKNRNQPLDQADLAIVAAGRSDYLPMVAKLSLGAEIQSYCATNGIAWR